mgnify:CR=1 FL=1
MGTPCSRLSKKNPLIYTLLFILALSNALVTQLSFADNFETEESLNAAINSFLEPKLQDLKATRLSIQIGRIDPRLKLQKCSQPLRLEQLGNKNLSGRVNIRINCDAPSWGIFIPVDIQIFEPVVVSRVTLPRGSVISRELLTLREVESSSLNYSYYRNIDQVVGTETTKSIQANSVIFSNMVQASNAVRKGDEVIIKAQIGGLSVRIKGLALHGGAIGEQIQVRNIQSRRIIRAVITGPGSVLVPM